MPSKALDREVIAEYAETIKHGDPMPSLTAFYDGADYWLADGFHRAHAFIEAGKSFVDVEVRQGSRRDAILFSVGANSSHGLRRSNADKRRAVEMLLGDEEWSQKSDRWIAKKCGVHGTFVGKLRPASATTAVEQQLTERLGQDGKVRRLPVRRQEDTVTERDDASDPGDEKLEEIRPKKHPRIEAADDFAVKVAELDAKGLGSNEIAEVMGVRRGRVQDAKRRIKTGSTRGKVRTNPLAGLVGFAIEFTDAWQDALPSIPQICETATGSERAELLNKLEALMFISGARGDDGHPGAR